MSSNSIPLTTLNRPQTKKTSQVTTRKRNKSNKGTTEEPAHPIQKEAEKLSNHQVDDSPEVPQIDLQFVNDSKTETDWRMAYVEFLRVGEIPEDTKMQAKLKGDAWRFCVIYDSKVTLQLYGEANEFQHLLYRGCGNARRNSFRGMREPL